MTLVRSARRAVWPRFARLFAALALAPMGFAIAVPAAAHAELIGSEPADGATLASPPAAVVLEFDEPVQAQFAEVAVLDESDGAHQQGSPQVDGGTVSQPVDELAPGAYRISFRVVSDDGHPVTGTLGFTVTAPAATTQPTSGSEPASQPTSPSQDGGKSSTEIPTTPPVSSNDADTGLGTVALAASGVAVAAVVGAVLYVLIGRRRPQRPGDGEGAEAGH